MTVVLTDRVVHGLTALGDQIVRYDRAGKWYVEPQGAPRRRLTLAEAATLAASGTAYAGLPGGSQFDKLVLELRG